MRLRKLSSQDSLEVSEFSNLRVGEGTELEDEDHMIHINDKFIVPGNDISDLVSSVYGSGSQPFSFGAPFGPYKFFQPPFLVVICNLRNFRIMINTMSSIL